MLTDNLNVIKISYTHTICSMYLKTILSKFSKKDMGYKKNSEE